jgi:hypothetical protein
MFGTLNLRFFEDILAFLAWRLFGLLYEKTANFFQIFWSPCLQVKQLGAINICCQIYEIFFSPDFPEKSARGLVLIRAVPD